ncbi:hypothetical protein LDC_1597, partial [sediment metagenome]
YRARHGGARDLVNQLGGFGYRGHGCGNGVAATDVVDWGFNQSPLGVTGYNAASTSGCLVITAYPTANNVNFLVSNPTASSITPGALTLNWKVVR